jgi:hypothetical protein
VFEYNSICEHPFVMFADALLLDGDGGSLQRAHDSACVDILAWGSGGHDEIVADAVRDG